MRALATSPKLLLLDEPAAGMNPSETAELTETIRRIRDEFNIAVLLIEHDMSLVMGICEGIAVLNFGRIIAKGTPDEIRNNPQVIEAYLGKKEAEPMAETMLKVDNINVYYGNIHAVKDVSFEVHEGEIVTLIGANGAGKSTTLKTISGLLHPKTGDILYKGKSIKACAPIRSWRPVWHRCRRPPCVPAHDRGGKPGYGGLHPTRFHHCGQQGKGVHPLPPPEGAPQAAGGHHVRRRAADAGHGPCPDEQRLHADAGRAFHGLSPLLVQEIFEIIRDIHKAGMTILLVEQNAQMALSVADRAMFLRQATWSWMAPVQSC